jgi:hypothetical protein
VRLGDGVGVPVLAGDVVADGGEPFGVTSRTATDIDAGPAAWAGA